MKQESVTKLRPLPGRFFSDFVYLSQDLIVPKLHDFVFCDEFLCMADFELFSIKEKIFHEHVVFPDRTSKVRAPLITCLTFAFNRP